MLQAAAVSESDEDYLFKVEPCEPSSNLTLESVLEPAPPPSHVDITTHIPDLFAALKYATTNVSSVSSSAEYAVSAPAFVRWLIHRCHAQITHRFKMASKKWKIQSSQITVLPAYRAYFRRRNLADLTLEEDGSILFDHSTIGAWGDTLLRLSDTLMVIDFFLHQKAVEFAFADTSLAYRFSFGYLGHDDDAYDEFFSDHYRSNESPGEQAFRYLCTLTAWNTAGRVVINALRKTTIPRVSIVHLGNGLNTFETNRDTFANELQSRIMELSGVALDIVSDWSSLDLRVRNVTVHAEAGLMALAYYVKHNKAKAKGELLEKSLGRWRYVTPSRMPEGVRRGSTYHEVGMTGDQRDLVDRANSQ
ncbi:hypothetical protein C8Q74DRAFT_1371293 [Fomes fomentarius]|nr:hypothetical protein C8Q74DRAFT_1371293 [Fomes fomentarius]